MTNEEPGRPQTQGDRKPRATARDRPYYTPGPPFPVLLPCSSIVGAIPCGRPGLAVAL
ncbi:MAG TPA: hypothetical protein VKR06_34890 [Ktedonosporobacter sp.]|nr:hypothetical protein [Ktedonosporobacter sp.]